MKRKVLQLIGMSTLVALSTAAEAGKVDYVDVTKSGINIFDGIVIVKPVSGTYSQIAKPTVSYHTEMKAGCNGANVLKSAFVAFGNENAGGGILEYSDNYRVPLSTGQAKTMPYREATLNVPVNKLGIDPVQMCKDMMSQKMAQGANKQQILAQDQVINRQMLITGVAACGFKNSGNQEYGVDKIGTSLKVICKAGSVAGISDIQMQTPGPLQGAGSFNAVTQVTAASLKATPYKTTSTCPAEVKFTGTITASGPGEVKYRVLFPGTANSGVRTLTFDKAGTKGIGIVKYHAESSIPTGSATLEILSPGSKKAFANFKLACVTAGGPASVGVAPLPQNSPGGRVEKAPPVKLNIGTIEVEPKEPPKRLPPRQQSSD